MAVGYFVKNSVIATIILVMCISAIFSLYSIVESTFKAFVKSIFCFEDEPSGIQVSKTQAPEFIDRIKALRNKIGFPKFDKILLNGDVNVSVCRIPRFGIFGGAVALRN